MLMAWDDVAAKYHTLDLEGGGARFVGYCLAMKRDDRDMRTRCRKRHRDARSKSKSNNTQETSGDRFVASGDTL